MNIVPCNVRRQDRKNDYDSKYSSFHYTPSLDTYISTSYVQNPNSMYMRNRCTLYPADGPRLLLQDSHS